MSQELPRLVAAFPMLPLAFIFVIKSAAGYADPISKAKAATFLKAKCNFAAGDFVPDVDRISEICEIRKQALSRKDSGPNCNDVVAQARSLFSLPNYTSGTLYPEVVLCVWNASFKQGTIHEINGCSLGYYNPGTDEFSPAFPKDPLATLLRNEICSKETVEKLLADENIVNRMSPYSPTKMFFVDSYCAGYGKSLWKLAQCAMANQVGHIAFALESVVLVDDFGVAGSLTPKPEVMNPHHAIAEGDRKAVLTNENGIIDRLKSMWRRNK